MKKIRKFLKVEYIVTIIIFLTVIYSNFKMSVWFIGCVSLLLNLISVSKKDRGAKIFNRWRMNINGVFAILIIIYGVVYKENLWLLAGSIAFITCIYNLANSKE